MRIHASREGGSALMITLLTTMLIGFSLASYLDLVSSQDRAVRRSEYWNAAIPILEAGIEEALMHLNYDFDRAVASDGWTLVNDVYRKERYLGDNKYVVTISKDKKTIISRAYVFDSTMNAFIEPPRGVKVTVRRAPLMNNGMVAKGRIDLSGNQIRTDSFNSLDPRYNTGGMYDPNKTNDKGDVGTNSSVVDTLDVWNAEIKGKARTGPGGLPTIGPNGSVGSKEWVESGKKGIQSGFSPDDMNAEFREVRVPFSGGAVVPASGTVGGVKYVYVLDRDDGKYELSSLSLSGQAKVLVTGKNVILYVKGNVSLSGQGEITLAPTASLSMYVGGASTSLGGNGVANPGGNALQFQYWGLPSNKSLSLSGNAAFTGIIYAPDAALTLGGGGNDPYDFVGASTTGSVKMNGHYQFHFDENLESNGPRGLFVVDNWNELQGSELLTYEEI